MKKRTLIIQNYIDAYNSFDVEGMITDFDSNIVFENISNGETNMSLVGITAFKEQAEQAKNYFVERTQIIEGYQHQGDETTIAILYNAVLAIDFPNGLKKGDELKLQGRSIFKFHNNKIIKLTDIS
jgi:hypothetical protein